MKNTGRVNQFSTGDAEIDILENEEGITNFDEQSIKNSSKIALAGLKKSPNPQEDLQKIITYISNLDKEIERLSKSTSESITLSDIIKERDEFLDKLFDPELLKIDGIASYIAESNSNLEKIILEKDPEYIKSFQEKLYQEKLASLSNTSDAEEEKLKKFSEYFRKQAEESKNIILYNLYIKSHENLMDTYYDQSINSHLDKFNEERAKTFDKDAALKSEVKWQNKVLMARKHDREYLKNKKDNHDEFLATLEGRSYEDKKALFLAHFLKESAAIYVQDHNSRADVKLPIKQKFEVLLTSNKDPVISELVGELKGSLDTYIARMDKTLGSELGKYGAGEAYRKSILPNSPYIKTAAKLEKLAEVKTKEEKVSLAAKAYKAIKDFFGNSISIFSKVRSEGIDSEKSTFSTRSSSSSIDTISSEVFETPRGSINSRSSSSDSISSNEFFDTRTGLSESEPESALDLDKQSRSLLDKIKRRYTKSQVTACARKMGIRNPTNLLSTNKQSRERV